MGLRLLEGDCLSVLRTLPDQSIQCCVTSPPYWGLRDYGTARWEGGDAACDHRQGRPGAGRADGVVDERAQRNRDGVGSMGGNCRACGAKRIDAQLGLEPTPDEYVAKLVAVFREVRRVLADDGTLWLNLGDSYAASWPCRRPERSEIGAGSLENGKREARPERLGPGLKNKDLVGIPWRVAFALQADGWYLRSDIIWSKPNPMPESVTDRPTKAHEYLFLLSKSERYYYDADAIAEPSTGQNGAAANFARTTKDHVIPGQSVAQHRDDREPTFDTGTRNRRSVWTVATQPYAEAHFATFPPELVSPCVLAGCPPGAMVLDPFGGSGTVAGVAALHGRDATLIELNPDYAAMIPARVASIREQAFGRPALRKAAAPTLFPT